MIITWIIYYSAPKRPNVSRWVRILLWLSWKSDLGVYSDMRPTCKICTKFTSEGGFIINYKHVLDICLIIKDLNGALKSVITH